MWDFLQTLAGKVSIISASVVGLIGILEKFTSLKLWTWIKKKIEKNRIEKFKPITDKIDKLTNIVEDNRVKEIRYQILEFEKDLIINYDAINLYYFNNIEAIIKEYETTYADKHNGEIKESIDFIRKKKAEKKEEELKKSEHSEEE